MKTVTLHSEASTIKHYWSILKGVNSSCANWTAQFTGGWKDNRDTEEIIEDIRSSRTINEEIDL